MKDLEAEKLGFALRPKLVDFGYELLTLYSTLLYNNLFLQNCSDNYL